MSFFDLPQQDLEEERRRFLEGGSREDDENVPVYNWGEESYDGLGDALQEGGDELNDETFGVGEVGKDFDFSQPSIPGLEPPPKPVKQDNFQDQGRQSSAGTRQQQQQHQQQPTQPTQTASSRPGGNSLESIWDDKSPFSVLPKSLTNGSTAVHRNQDPQLHHQHQPSRSVATPSVTQTAARFTPFDGHQQQPIGSGIGNGQQRALTLQEIEAEMLAQAARRRQLEQERQMEHLLLQQRQQQQIEEQRRLREQELIQRDLLLQQQQQQQQKDLQYQRLLQMQQRQQAQIQQQQHLQGPQRTPPPRMLAGASQSPRFLEHQRTQQALLLEQERQQQLLLQERERQHQRLLQDREKRQVQQMLDQQHRIEELEKRLAHNLMLEGRPGSPWQQGLQDAPHYVGDQQLPVHRQFATPSPARHLLQQQQAQFGHGIHEVVPQQQQPAQSLQMQQRLLAELAQHGIEMGGNQEQLRMEAMRKILEAEKMEEKRRRKAQKLAYMARYNDLMTQSDKDFITRIQVSQLVTQDPYADDFYAQVFGALRRSQLGIQSQDERVLKFGSGGGVGLGLAPKGATRRPSAMQRMEQQVERIVQNARKREEEKSLHSLHALQGALGKTSGRSYKAAPRQLLQVDATSSALSPSLSKSSAFNEGAAKEAEKLGREALGDAAHHGEVVRKDPLTHREALVILERLYDLVMRLEHLRHNQPHPEEPPEVQQEWQQDYEQTIAKVWDEIKVNVPLNTSDPHPFISLLGPTKGKRILPRLTRQLPSDKMLIVVTLLVACFDQLDVVRKAPLLDSFAESTERADVERETEAFLSSVMQSIMPVMSVAELRLVTGLLGLLLDKTNVVAVAQTQPGLALVTMFLTRVYIIIQAAAMGSDQVEIPTPDESDAWQRMFDHLFQLLSPHFMLLFPSTRIVHTNITGQLASNPALLDSLDTPTWRFLGTLASLASREQHSVLVTHLRLRIIEHTEKAEKGWVASEEERATKLANVNYFLHAIGLDSSQIALA